jgi:hypothetical protein
MPVAAKNEKRIGAMWKRLELVSQLAYIPQNVIAH